MKLKIKNSKINANFLLAILVIYELIVISAVDIYVPALPQIRDEFFVSEAYLNLTLFVFLFVSAVTILFAGRISDKIGRKPLMIISGIIFTIGGIISALAPTVEIIIFGRLFQAAGTGFVCALTTAIVKEAFDEKSVKLAITLLQSLILIGPFLAPFIGTYILSLFD